VEYLKITILSTMLSDEAGIGEWGFAALLDADGRLLLIDTGKNPETVLRNARDLKIDLSPVRQIVLTHWHPDHTGGLSTLRTELKKSNPAALSEAHVATGIFWSRPSQNGEANPMIAIRPKYEANGAKFIEHDRGAEVMPGIWLTGPVARITDERNYVTPAHVRAPSGLIDDNIPDDQSIVVRTTKGMVVITGCGHAGVINILTAANKRFPGTNVEAVIGGLHLVDAKDERLDWTAAKLKTFGVNYLIGAHCTGIESLYRLRDRMGLTRKTAVVGAVGASFVLGEGIHPGRIAQ
jgi:7,8-dihydropterin-6-yl-methyl-4-(beta-D-ribofuranosyl)aminobenzene 5'-phosphate synthase